MCSTVPKPACIALPPTPLLIATLSYVGVMNGSPATIPGVRVFVGNVYP